MHVLRPLYVILALVAVILIVRSLLVPKDFGIQERGYMYGWYRLGNEKEWKAFKVKFRGWNYCQDCHTKQVHQVGASRHSIIECENCHGPAQDHPAEPPKLLLDRGRELCLRCHTFLPYPSSQRSEIKGINPEAHNPGGKCVACHDPHKASKPM